MGMDIGFEKAGFETVYANDIERFAYDTIRKNKSSISCDLGDITKITSEQIMQKAGLSQEPDVVIGGPPCQSFSTAGTKFNLSNGSLSSEKFRIASNGDATFGGALTAATGTFSGSIAGASGTFTGGISGTGYTLNNSGLTLTNASSSISLGNSVTLTSSGLAGSNFTLNSSGLTATGVTVTGEVNATSGTFTNIDVNSGAVGGWSINSTSIYTGTEDHSDYTASDGDMTFYSNGTDSSIHAKNFYITTAGDLVARDVTLTGEITATSGDIGGWSIGGSNTTLEATGITIDSANKRILIED